MRPPPPAHPRAAPILLLALFLSVAPAAAQKTVQASGGGDLGYAPGYVWRGITRSEAWVAMPAVWGRLDWRGSALAAGVWSAWEPRRGRGGETTFSGRGERGVAEVDVWVQYTRRTPWADVSGGVIRYAFAGDPRDGGLGSEAGTTEVYVQGYARPGLLPADPRVALYWDVDRTRARYLEWEVSRSLSLIPVPNAPVALLAALEGGVSLDASGASPERLRFVEEGLTHLELSGVLTLEIDGVALHGGVHHQWNLDPATERVSAARQAPRRFWTELGVSFTTGRKARTP